MQTTKGRLALNYTTIANEKYINFFCSSVEKNMNDDECRQFLDEMSNIVEGSVFPMPPSEIIKAIYNRLNLNCGVTKNIKIIASNRQLLNKLSSFEIFTLLWLVSCRNMMCFNEELYLIFANNGTIGRLLLALANSN